MMIVMPYRITPITTGEIYHVFNKSVGKQTMFPQTAYYERFLHILSYYMHQKTPIRFSYFLRLPPHLHKEIEKQLQTIPIHVELYAFCLMPTHFHLLIKETEKGGLSTFLSTCQNSYAKFFNTKNQRGGALFRAMFKCKRIGSDEHFLHVARYIHLNPYTSGVIRSPHELISYPWSSLSTYLDGYRHQFVSTDFLMKAFSSKKSFLKWTLDQADYQKTLEDIRHLIE